MQIPEQLPIYNCRRISDPFMVDGNLLKPIWQSVPQMDLRLANDNGIPVQSTTVRACWDGENLYLGFECQDTDIRATFTQRDDRVWQEEAVEAFIAPYGDLRHYYEFQCSPINTIRDVKVISPNARAENVIFDGSWDCAGWQSAVSLQSEVNNPMLKGQVWIVEWRIPLGELLDPAAGPVLAGEEWRVNLFRIDRWPQEEYSSWSVTPGFPFSFHRPTFFGRWLFD
jgi:Carbohydrate-binding family 9